MVNFTRQISRDLKSLLSSIFGSADKITTTIIIQSVNPKTIVSATVFLAAAKSWTLELLAFDEYCCFDNSDFFLRIERGSLYTEKESRSIKTAIFIES